MHALRFVPLVLGLICFTATPAAAQKVHALLVADMSPGAKWGEFLPNLQEDMLRMMKLLQTGCPRDSLSIQEVYLDSNADAKPAKIVGAIEDLRANRNDTIVIYYTGHGGIDDRGSYFDLVGGKLYRDDLIAAAKEHGSRLVVLVTDCCNARNDKEVQTFPRAGFYERDDYSPLFRSLLIEPKGVVDINACGPGESAFFSPPPKKEGDEIGSLFTKGLAGWCEERNDKPSSWDALLSDVGVRVHLMFREAYPSGVAVAKGVKAQTDQNVYARSYPGMPAGRGIRLGLAVRSDADAAGATIVEVVEGSPATKAYDIENEHYVAIAKGKRITAMNGRKIAGPNEFEDAIKTSPQIMRLTIAGADRTERDYLVRLRY